MPAPILVLQYPDRRRGRTVALATTTDWEALTAFKRAALSEARLEVLRWEEDEPLRIQGQAELRRLEALMAVLIPEDEGPEDSRGNGQ